MKTILRITLSVVSCLLLFACEKETILTVNQSSLSFNNAGGNQSVSLVANKVWSASSNQSWCRLSPSSGDGSDNSNFNLSVSCDANPTYDERSCTITIVCEELTSTISVTQAEGKGLILSQTEYNITNEAQTISVEVQANVQYTVTIDDACKSWIKQESTKGLSSNTIKFAILKNEEYDGREGKITIKQTDGSLSGTVVVKQSQQNGLFVATSEYNLSNEKHTLTVEVKANVEFDVKPNVEWIRYVETKGLKTSQIVLEIAENEDYDSREGTVSVKQKNGSLEGVITVRQEQNYDILVSQSEFSISNEAQAVDVEVKYNVDFDVVIPDACKDWISIVGTKGLSSRNYTFSIAENKSYDNREGSITFKQKNGSLSGTVAIKQSQTDGLFAEKTEYEVSHEEQVLNIVVKANIEYQVQIDEDCKGWISQVQTKGLSESSVSLQINENEGNKRTGKVLIMGNDKSETVLIKQKSGYIEFSDNAFKTYCVNHFDRNSDGEISYSEALGVSDISCDEKNIKSLSGIEYFKDLTRLRCISNQLCSLDVSKNTALVELTSQQNQLVYLNVSNNPALETIQCGENRLSSLDVSSCTKLWGLWCYSNQITSLDLSKNTALRSLQGDMNKFGELDFSNNPALEWVWCSYCELTKLDVSKNTGLRQLRCGGNQLTSLDISNNLALTELLCSDNQLTSLDISKHTSLTSLWCGGNPLKTLDVTNNTALSDLLCNYNQLTSLDLSKNTALVSLWCSDNELTSLDVSNNTALKDLYCSDNKLTGIDVSKNTLLSTIWCSSNDLTALDVSNNTELTALYCSNCKLTTLDVSNNILLHSLECTYNPYLTEIWLNTNQTIDFFNYDKDVATIKYK